MRWESSGTASFGVTASAFALGSRDESARFYYYHEPSNASTSANISQTSHDHGSLHGKKPHHKTKGAKGSSRGLKASHELKSRAVTGSSLTGCTKSDPVGPELESVDSLTALPEKSTMIMCAGKNFCGLGNESNNIINKYAGLRGEYSRIPQQRTLPNSNQDCTPHGIRFETMEAVVATKSKGTDDTDHSLSRQRTDEELEQIIRDLRDQIFNQQNQQQPQQREQEKKTLAHSASQEYPAGGSNLSRAHYRKHLKSPLERMEGAVARPPCTSSNNESVLQRPLSSSQLSRLVTDSTSNMVVPAIIYGLPPVTAQDDSMSSTDRSDSADVTSIDSRPSSAVQQSMRLGEGAILNPRHVRPKRAPSATRIQRERNIERSRMRDRRERSSSCNNSSSYSTDNFLYLVDVEDCSDVSESTSLSPVGPWIVDNLYAGSFGTPTPRSPSVSTCYTASSFGDEEDGDSEPRELNSSELAAMSPRSRLLYFSACASDDVGSTLRRTATCSSDITMNVSADERSKRLTKRCSSAKSALRGGSRAASASRRKVPSRAAQAKKRPQSGAARSNQRHQQ